MDVLTDENIREKKISTRHMEGFDDLPTEAKSLVHEYGEEGLYAYDYFGGDLNAARRSLAIELYIPLKAVPKRGRR